jgi:hypothetical protein
MTVEELITALERLTDRSVTVHVWLVEELGDVVGVKEIVDGTVELDVRV